MSTSAGVELRRHGGDTLDEILDELAELYEQVYSEPPYGGTQLFTRDRFLARTNTQKIADGFEAVTARAGETLVGFCFGFSFDAGRWWGGQTRPEPPAEIIRSSKFAVIELVVAKPHRGRKLGRALITTLLSRRPEPWATLLSLPDAPARQIYTHWGWRHIADIQPATDAPWMHVLILPLDPP